MLTYLQSIAAITIIASLLFVSGCKKSENPANPSDSNGISFSGITKTDTLCNIMEDDTSDWQPRYENRIIPSEYILYAMPACPNPAGRDSVSFGNGERRLGCKIDFAIFQASSVEVRVYDRPNRYITTLVRDTLIAGYYSVLWELQDSLHRPVPDGIYRVVIATQTQQSHGDIQVLR